MSDRKDEQHGSPCPEVAPSAIPMTERRGPLTMGLLWVTMVTGFPTVLAGFDWYKQGFTLQQIAVCVVISSLILLAYSIPACYLGAKTGLSYIQLSKETFGKKGSWFVSFNITWSSIAWYALTATFLADGLKSLFHFDISTAWLAGGLAVLMACNNFFGFTGVANFARYAAGPVLIVWMVYCFGKAAVDVPPSVLSEPTTQPFFQALGAVSAFIIGYAIWGNEADYWRYGNPSVKHTVVPLAVAIGLGQIIFPIAGWLVAYLTHTSDPTTATAVMNTYTFGSATILAAVVLTVSYMAGNDSLLFACDHAVENVYRVSRRVRVAVLSVIGAALSSLFSQDANSFSVIAALSAIILPAATTIMMVEAFYPMPGRDSCAWRHRAVGWPAIISVLVGTVVGVATSGLIPGIAAFGVPSLQGWLSAMLAYVPLRRIWK